MGMNLKRLDRTRCIAIFRPRCSAEERTGVVTWSR